MVRFGRKGQSTIEYVLILLFGALFSIQMGRFFNDVFQEGLVELEENVSKEVRTGEGFASQGRGASGR